MPFVCHIPQTPTEAVTTGAPTGTDLAYDAVMQGVLYVPCFTRLGITRNGDHSNDQRERIPASKKSDAPALRRVSSNPSSHRQAHARDTSNVIVTDTLEIVALEADTTKADIIESGNAPS